jgi:hypothetical protein
VQPDGAVPVGAMHLLRERPEIPFGVHLTLFCDTTHYGWGPLTAREKVPSPVKPAWPGVGRPRPAGLVVLPGPGGRPRPERGASRPARLLG